MHDVLDPPPDQAVPEYVLSLERAASYLPPDQLQRLRRAWAVGAAAHAGQSRKSGEPYITHPVAVAEVLAEQRLDVETLIAATRVSTSSPWSASTFATATGWVM
jgi:guanosine-3',5'-bis(diphosphate) 3'-pyrophosphohydrolase